MKIIPWRLTSPLGTSSPLPSSSSLTAQSRFPISVCYGWPTPIETAGLALLVVSPTSLRPTYRLALPA